MTDVVTRRNRRICLVCVAFVLVLGLWLRLSLLGRDLPFIYGDEWKQPDGAITLMQGKLPYKVNSHPGAVTQIILAGAFTLDWIGQNLVGSRVSCHSEGRRARPTGTPTATCTSRSATGAP